MTNVRNNSLKDEFLFENIDNGIITSETAKSYARIFGIISNFETALDKDVSEFNLTQLEAVLFNFKANNRNTIESYSRIISSYLNWCVQNGHIKTNILSAFKPDDFEKYLTNEEEYIQERKLRRYEGACANSQDAIILRLLFIGVGGKQMSEIRNLKKSDIDREDMKIKLINSLKEDREGMPVKFTERFLSIDEYTLDLIDKAINQKTYAKRNGYMIDTPENVRKFTDLVDNDYVVRSSITKTEHWNVAVDKFVIYRRIQTLAETLGIELTAKFIQRSGMIYFANKLMGNSNEIMLDDLKIIADQFNMKSYHNLKGFITVENINKTYPKNKNEGELLKWAKWLLIIKKCY